MKSEDILEELKKLISIADIGLLYQSNEYDLERYREIKEISLQLSQQLTSATIEQVKKFYPDVADYPTAKVDIRGLALSENGEILMVKEIRDGKWSLPGGWADIGCTPKEVITKEFKEETGLDIVPSRLLAVFDKKMHPHPFQPFYVYKMAFYCKILSTEIVKGFDVMDVQFFNIKALPELSEDRILSSQIELLYRKAISPEDTETYCD